MGKAKAALANPPIARQAKMDVVLRRAIPRTVSDGGRFCSGKEKGGGI